MIWRMRIVFKEAASESERMKDFGVRYQDGESRLPFVSAFWSNMSVSRPTETNDEKCGRACGMRFGFRSL